MGQVTTVITAAILVIMASQIHITR